jgi:acyl-ACP thioesterase
MEQMSYITTYRYPVPSYLCGGDQNVKPHGILHFFEDAAWRHAEQLGFGYSQFYALGRMWVLSRVRIEMERYPTWQEEIDLSTWPAGLEKLFASRHFEGFSPEGTRLFGSTTQWLLLDAERGRPIPPARVFSEDFQEHLPERRACHTEPLRLTAAASARLAAQLVAGYSSIDVNQHVNNAEFVRWGFDTIAEEFAELPRVIEIDFKSAVQRDESIEVRVGSEDATAESGESRTVAIYATGREGFEESGGEAVSVVRFGR